MLKVGVKSTNIEVETGRAIKDKWGQVGALTKNPLSCQGKYHVVLYLQWFKWQG